MAQIRWGTGCLRLFGWDSYCLHALLYSVVYLREKGSYVDCPQAVDGEILNRCFLEVTIHLPAYCVGQD